MKIHLTAIGGSVMHNLAIALHDRGYIITGSDDEVFEPSLSRLQEKGLMPAQLGWFPEKITADLDALILGRHAKADNPELLKAKELGIKTYSFPEYIREHSKNKQRIVIGGSHGKTTITAMIMHVLQHHELDFDYLIGAGVEGYENSVRLTDSAPMILIEGDEYPSSALDNTPKFLHYHHHIGVVSGVSWDHANIYKDAKAYEQVFAQFISATPKAGQLIYSDEGDLGKMVKNLVGKREEVGITEYKAHKSKEKNGEVNLVDDQGHIWSISVYGEHNLKNISAAAEVCAKLSIKNDAFYVAISSFRGASMRLQTVAQNNKTVVIRDYAHAPSKVKASVLAVKGHFKKKKITACFELHTYSSLSKNFLPNYAGTLDAADEAIVYHNPHASKLKGLEPLDDAFVFASFKKKGLKVFSDSAQLKSYLESTGHDVLLMMSSGNFGGINAAELI